MVERNVSRPWTDEEDELLRQGVAEHGDTDHWKTIASSIPGRSNKSCRKRWLHSLQPNVKKSAWTPDEDKLLIELFMTYGPRWSTIARQILGRTDDACSKRYREALNPNLKKEDWTPEEDEKLIEAYNSIGGKWGQVGQTLQRSGLGCRNRWRLLERKKASISHQITHPQEGSAIHEPPAQVHYENEHLLMNEWPPYYPPEAYSTFSQQDDLHFERPFREPTPEVLDIPDPNIAPFQFSSSSLSAALSDPALPPSSVSNTPDLMPPVPLNDCERQPSLSPLSQCDGIPEVNDVLMSFDNFSNQTMDQHGMENFISITYESDHMDNMSFNPADYPFYFSASPISISSEITQITDASQNIWKPRNMCEIELDNSPFSVFGMLHDGQESSSTSSTPYLLSSPLSPTSSPYASSAVDLPMGEQPSSNSLLFSPPDEPHVNTAPRPKKATSVRKRSKASIKAASASRLSSTLSLLWNDIRPYACGHDECWPTRGRCFATSGELVEHIKEQHPECDSTGKPYRCALSGCDKSWKSINGLQYHLQISMSHFTGAMFSKFSAQHPNSSAQNTPSSSTLELKELEPERKFTCPRAGCLKAYRQSSGLRYHVKHGHPSDMPAQLPIVPPMVEQQMSTKIRKLRPKPSFESTIV
jgi:myb proto-oncogene protein/Myb-like DNA-binding protein BAS1